MSDRAWLPEDPQRERLPRVDDLPTAPEGYDPEAVRAAFDAFYRHAAELDATLRTLEAVEAFQRQAGELRSDIRALRAAAWGPVPATRTHAWHVAYRRGVRSGPQGAVSDALPRVVVETAFIVLVGVGAAVAELETFAVVVLIGAALLIVAATEVVASAAQVRRRRRASVQPAPVVAPEPAPTVVAPPLAVEAPDEPEPPAEAAPAPEGPVATDEAASEPPRRRLWRRRAPAAPPAAGDPAAASADVVAGEPDQPLQPEAEEPPLADETEQEPAARDGEEEAPPVEPWEPPAEAVPVAGTSEVTEAEAPRRSRLRFFARRRREEAEQQIQPVHEPSGHVQVIAVRPVASPVEEPRAADEDMGEVDAPAADERGEGEAKAATAPVPSPPVRLRRGRR